MHNRLTCNRGVCHHDITEHTMFVTEPYHALNAQQRTLCLSATTGNAPAAQLQLPCTAANPVPLYDHCQRACWQQLQPLCTAANPKPACHRPHFPRQNDMPL
jgi:hypothetical protein